MSYTVILTPRAGKQIKTLPPADRERVKECIDGLRIEPRPVGCEKIEGRQHMYRVRTGDYRVVYELRRGDLIVTVVLVAHRRDVYQQLMRLH